jgi:hypothetical protein
MTKPKEPREKPADINHESDHPKTLSLVDFFDRMDREAFHRVLGDHDPTDPGHSGN